MPRALPRRAALLPGLAGRNARRFQAQSFAANGSKRKRQRVKAHEVSKAD
jgi:hypothetical protein